MDPWEFMQFLIRWTRKKSSYRQDLEDFASWAYLHTEGFTKKGKNGRVNRNPKFLFGTYLQEFEPRKGVKVIKDISSGRVQLYNEKGVVRKLRELEYEMPDPLDVRAFYGKITGSDLRTMRAYLEQGFTVGEISKRLKLAEWKTASILNKNMKYLKERHAKS